jgi:hypothetical protein
LIWGMPAYSAQRLSRTPQRDVHAGVKVCIGPARYEEKSRAPFLGGG